MVLSSLRPALAAATLLSLCSLSTQQAIPTATYHGPMNAISEAGCYDDYSPLDNHGPYIYQSSGNCQPICYGLNKPVMALANGSNCYCGDLLPALSAKVDDSECNTPCQGFDQEMCTSAFCDSSNVTNACLGGGNQKWRVMLTGITKNQIEHYDVVSPTATNKAKSTILSQAVVTVGGETVIVTSHPTATSAVSSTASTGSSPSKAGIAAGVVVGVVVLSAIVGGVFLLLRHRRRRQVEEEYRRQAAVNDFVLGGKGSSIASLSDSRLDPETMMARRMSDGSIMDNQDYSRRILKVTNPDGH